MSKEINARLYEAKWNLQQAIEKKDYGSHLDWAHEHIIRAKADAITEMDKEPEVDRPEKSVTSGPIIMKNSTASVKVRGKFNTPSGKFDMICIHYHAGAEDMDSRKDADNMLSYIGSRGLGCIALDHDGTFYQPKNMNYLTQWGSNIGRSKYRSRSALSQYACGIEVINSGKLTDFKGKYYAWYDLKYDEKKPWIPIAVKSGRSPHPNPRIVIVGNDNHTIGAWDPFTEAQEKALLNFCITSLKMLPDLKIEHIRGHDEFAWPRGRKSDPGASFSLTMPEFRKLLTQNLKNF